MGNSPQNSWKKLDDSPFGSKHCGRSPIVINDEFIVSPELSNKLYTFNTKSTVWNQDEFGQHKSIWFQSLCRSNDGKHIYLYDGHNANILLIIDVTSKTIVKTITNITKTGIWPSILADPENDNILHIIGGSSNNSHLTINIDTEEMKTVHIFNKIDSLLGGGIIYLRKLQIALLFHGDIPVYKYKFKNKKWENTKIKFPMTECKSFGYVVTEDNKYVLIFGGGNRDGDGWNFSDSIFIFDVNQMCFTKSKIKCPKYYNMNAAITGSGDIHLFHRQYHWVKHIGDILPQYAVSVHLEQDNDKTIYGNEEEKKEQNDQKKEWQCTVCTFLNMSSNELCTMCNTGKRADIKPIPKDNDNIKMVQQWLKNEVNLPQYIPLFINEGYDDIVAVETMNEDDLMDIGVNKKGHRKKLMVFINKYKNEKENNNNNITPNVAAPNMKNNDIDNTCVEEVEGINIVDTNKLYIDKEGMIDKHIQDTFQ